MPAPPDDRPLLLLVDDDTSIVETLAWAFGPDFETLTAGSRPEALNLLRGCKRPIDAALIDLGLPPVPHRPDEGLALVSELIAAAPDLHIVVLSGQDAMASARHARAIGAFEFHPKPSAPPVLREALLRAVARTRQARARKPDAVKLVGESPAIVALRQQLRRLADAPFPLLLEGESGTGKELAAQALHQTGSRAGKPFVAVNCAAIAPGLIEAALFGHARGAFTGATAARTGFFEEAGDGTLFLDEVGELPLELQPKLLRALENGEYLRVGETAARHASARVVTATNRNLRDEVKAGRFRADLYHRLSVLTLTLPALRTLGDDRFVLLEHYLPQLAAESALPPFALDRDARALWGDYAFPGNVRELRNIVLRLLARHAGETVGRAQLAAELDLDTGPRANADEIDSLQEGFSLDDALRRTERRYIESALALARGSMSQAARLLGINRTTLYGRIGVLGLRMPAGETRED
ncbi:sigma-54-dependent transcriptional regulator [Niveibacterium microcysteis]|uniref:Sigma-54-dependent Fis family transcriptional regulator n=1 Tax=Niveibacterium microcysteis TaxID=2811415 RepID=A0ABX7MDS9_9RHOO|nr:sigma-54 dependent transcriptional regulator [Niveibacterium microcysteis]QSI77912.1 sigma-54-dependent Fis family transcriptional regulator [Niveibacterium microcysteis]